MYGSSDMECNRQNVLSFWTISCSFTLLTTQKNQNFEKMKKLPGDIINLHRCNINDNSMKYGSWDTDCDGQNFLSFWTIFCTFTPLKTHKITKKLKFCKNEKNSWRYYHFTQVYHEWQSYDVWFLKHEAWQTGQVEKVRYGGGCPT